MPRPPRCRQIDSYPDHWRFAPVDSDSEEVLFMTLDEYETIRLIDKRGLTQEECAQKMGVARTTITNIYERARRKLADCLVDGKILQLVGGSYRLRRQSSTELKLKGEDAMRVAVPYESGSIFQHFGHTVSFKLFDVANGAIEGSQLVSTNGRGHGALVGFLKEAGADALICGGIGMGARNALAEAGIDLYGGVSGSVDEAVDAFIAGTLQYDSEATCNHHGEGHNCSDHDCGSDHKDHSCSRCGH